MGAADQEHPAVSLYPFAGTKRMLSSRWRRGTVVHAEPRRLGAPVRAQMTIVVGFPLKRVQICILGILAPALASMSPLSTFAQRPVQPAGDAATQESSFSPPASAVSDADRSNAISGEASTTPLGTALPAESLGKDDLLEIAVPYCPELSGRFRVGSDGKLVLPLLRDHIPVAGLTPAQAAVLISKALRDGQIMADPSVTVSVLEYRSRTVTILGAVLHPLTFQATGETTLLDAIAMAGGLAPNVGSSILITFPHTASQGPEGNITQAIPVEELVAKGNSIYNPALHGGEEIRVPEAGKIFVAGNVVRPGVYTMQGDKDTTVLKALALSAGLQQYSAHIAYIYRRSITSGNREEVKVPLSRIMARKDPDVRLLADDILYIPDNNGKRMTARVLGQISGFGQTTATGLLIYK